MEHIVSVEFAFWIHHDLYYNWFTQITSSKFTMRTERRIKCFDPLQALNVKSFLFLFAITAAGVVPCGGPKKCTRTSPIVQIIFSFWSFEIDEGILRNQKISIGFKWVHF